MVNLKDKIDKFKLSYSSLRDFEHQDVCIESWFRKWVIKDNRKEPSLAMKRGIYFESIALEDYGSKSRPLWEAPDGSNSVYTQRIRSSAGLLKEYLDPSSKYFQGIKPKAIDVTLESEREKGIVDLLGEDEDGRDVIIDIKLTQDLSSSYGFIDWHDDNLDASQLLMYYKLHKGNPRLLYYVFDYAKSQNKPIIIEKIPADHELDSLESRIDDFFSFFDNADWSLYVDERYTPTESNCNNCILECPFRFDSKSPLIKKL